MVAAADTIFLKQKTTLLTVWALLGILLGSIVYGWADVNFNYVGYFWLIMNVLSTSSYQVYVKKLTELKLTAFGMVYYNNLLSLPFFVLLAIATQEVTTLSQEETWSTLSSSELFVLLLSCLLGFSISFAGFTLNLLVSATTLMVINNVNKILFIVLSEYFYQSTLTASSALGAFFVLTCTALYSYLKLNPLELGSLENTKYKILSVVLFAIFVPLSMQRVFHSSPSEERY